jgi:N-acetylmuramoyl-L-alanine amidase
MIICIDPGHGMSNRRKGVYDSGAVGGNGTDQITEAEIVMTWANELRAVLLAMGHKVIRTRVDHKDPAPVGMRAKIAADYKCDVLISLHCNAANGSANGTETFYRGEANKALASACNAAIVASLGTRDRGIKTESQSQHSRLAVLSFPRAVLLELGFIDHAGDRRAMTDEANRKAACHALACAICKNALA